jgi:hypothetical protein
MKKKGDLEDMDSSSVKEKGINIGFCLLKKSLAEKIAKIFSEGGTFVCALDHEEHKISAAFSVQVCLCSQQKACVFVFCAECNSHTVSYHVNKQAEQQSKIAIHR